MTLKIRPKETRTFLLCCFGELGDGVLVWFPGLIGHTFPDFFLVCCGTSSLDLVSRMSLSLNLHPFPWGVCILHLLPLPQHPEKNKQKKTIQIQRPVSATNCWRNFFVHPITLQPWELFFCVPTSLVEWGSEGCGKAPAQPLCQ